MKRKEKNKNKKGRELISPADNPLLPQHEGDIDKLKELAIESFVIVEEALAKQGVTLVDFKIECGYDGDGKLRIDDVIDSDSYCLWIDGNEHHALDKDYLRKIAKLGRSFTLAEIAKIGADYAVVAYLTCLFLEE